MQCPSLIEYCIIAITMTILLEGIFTIAQQTFGRAYAPVGTHFKRQNFSLSYQHTHLSPTFIILHSCTLLPQQQRRVVWQF